MKKKNTTKSWKIGDQVQIGFMKLEVTGIKDLPSAFGHTVFELKSAKGVRYEFSAYEGVYKVGA
jgi:hypothetical protein